MKKLFLVCGDIDIRFDVAQFHLLEKCRTVQGNVVFLLFDDEVDASVNNNISFPLLTEITGYMLLYRVTIFKSLSQVFPNLSVIRGDKLFQGHSLIIYENPGLEIIGLENLKVIDKGTVRIEKNPSLCFVKTIDWSEIVHSNEENKIQNNKLQTLCPSCTQGIKNCWSLDKPQTYCNCNGNSCDHNGKCCDSSCMICDNLNSTECKICRNFRASNEKTCYDDCPEGTFKVNFVFVCDSKVNKKNSSQYQRFCLTSPECLSLNNNLNDLPFIPFNGSCCLGCPKGFQISKMNDKNMCVPGGLVKCRGKIIDSASAAQSLKGCQIIEGSLEIQIRTMSRETWIVKELESSLSDIVEIEDYLKVARSFPIVSLHFFKSLKVIRGKRLESNKYALVIWDNQNLQELWDEDQEIEIKSGKLFIHYNPKLCFYKIERIAKSSMQIENYEFAQKSNGDKTPCNVTKLEVLVERIFSHAALLNWKPLKLDDERSLLSYVVFYMPTPYQNITIWENRDACSNDG